MAPHEYRKCARFAGAASAGAKRPESYRGRRLKPVGEKVSNEADAGAAGRHEEPGERQSRLMGILLVVLGCVLMALAAGEAAGIYPALLSLVIS